MAPYRQDLVVLDAGLGASDADACDTIRMIFRDRGVVFTFPFGRPPFVRVVATAPPSPPGELGARSVALAQNALLALGARLERPRLVAKTTFHHAIAAQFRRSRVLLAGDAAHAHGPLDAGGGDDRAEPGQGIDAAFEDALSAAAKVAEVLDGRAPENWLDSYERERRTSALSLLQVTGRLFSLATSPSPVISAFRNAALSTVGSRMLATEAGRRRLLRFLLPAGSQERVHPSPEQGSPRTSRFSHRHY
jgi:2-polyprenyl-6-methoxyphenol hydroxylase-like FAD-dependent oxidoreductase